MNDEAGGLAFVADEVHIVPAALADYLRRALAGDDAVSGGEALAAPPGGQEEFGLHAAMRRRFGERRSMAGTMPASERRS